MISRILLASALLCAPIVFAPAAFGQAAPKKAHADLADAMGKKVGTATITPTKGGLVFAGDMDKHAYAFDAGTGKILWRVELPGAAAFIGFVGLMTPRFEAHFTPSVEVGWRIALKNSAGIDPNLMVYVRLAGSIAHQATGISEFTPLIDRGYRTAERQ